MAFSIFLFAPDLANQEISIAKKKLSCPGNMFFFQPELTFCNGKDVLIVIFSADTGKVFTRVFRYPNCLEMGSELPGKLRLTG